jgi:DNA-binding Lrp family transcriptional regulator
MIAPPINPVTAAIARAMALSPAERKKFVRRLRDLGIIDRPRRGERYPDRNAEIRALHTTRKLSPAQIGKQFGLTKSAVKAILRRGRKRGCAKPTYPATSAPTRRK